jgi:hypothetical protein
VVNATAPSTVVLNCNHEQTITAGQFGTPSFDGSQIVATRADSLDFADA